MYEVNLSDAAKQLHHLVNEAEQGEDVFITRGDGASFKIVPLSKVKPRPTFGSAKGEVWMSEDFDEPRDEVEDDIPS